MINRKLQEIQKKLQGRPSLFVGVISNFDAVQCQNRDWKNNQISKSLTKMCNIDKHHKSRYSYREIKSVAVLENGGGEKLFRQVLCTNKKIKKSPPLNIFYLLKFPIYL